MSVKKLFNIIIAGLAVLLFIFMFIPAIGNDYYKLNMWDRGTAFGVFLLFSYLGIIALYALNFFNILKDKWIGYANYAVGFVAIIYLTMLFDNIEYTRIGIWLGTIFALGMLVLSILWNFVGDKPMGGNAKKGKKITGYDPQTGKPIYAEPKGYDPQTGKPIYE